MRLLLAGERFRGPRAGRADAMRRRAAGALTAIILVSTLAGIHALSHPPSFDLRLAGENYIRRQKIEGVLRQDMAAHAAQHRDEILREAAESEEGRCAAELACEEAASHWEWRNEEAIGTQERAMARLLVVLHAHPEVIHEALEGVYGLPWKTVWGRVF